MMENYFDARRHAHHYWGIVCSKVEDLQRERMKIKGVFYLPLDYYLGGQYIAQVANASNNEIY